MKLSIIFLLFSLISVAQNNPPEVELKINNEIIPISFNKQSSAQNYSVFDLDSELQKIHYENLASIRIESTDEYGRPFNYIDSISVFPVGKRFQNIKCDNISISLSIDGKVVDHLTFAYQLLSESKRVPHEMIKVETETLSKFFCDISEDVKNPTILIYAIQFTDENGNMTTFSLGYTAFELI